MQAALIVFHTQYIARASLANRACHLGLRAHCIDGDDAAGDVEHLEQLGNRRDFVGLLGGRPLTQHHAHIGRKCADHMQWCRRLARGASARLPIDGDDLVLSQSWDDASHPGAKGVIELDRIEQREHVLEGIGLTALAIRMKEGLRPAGDFILQLPTLAFISAFAPTSRESATRTRLASSLTGIAKLVLQFSRFPASARFLKSGRVFSIAA